MNYVILTEDQPCIDTLTLRHAIRLLVLSQGRLCKSKCESVLKSLLITQAETVPVSLKAIDFSARYRMTRSRDIFFSTENQSVAKSVYSHGYLADVFSCVSYSRILVYVLFF